MRAMFELQVNDCLLRGDSSRLVSLLHYEGLTSSTLTRLHLLVTKELRSSAFCRVLVVLKSVSILSENKEDLETLVNLGLAAKVMSWFEAVHDLLTSDLQEGSTTLMALIEEFFDYFLSFLWGSIHLQMEDVDYYSLKFKQNETVLCVRLTNPIMHLNTRSHVVELTFDPEHQQELEEAAGRVFNVPKQASPSGAGGAVRTSPSSDTARSYTRKKPPSKSQLKILPLSSPSSEDESTSLKPTASNRAEVLFDQIVHSTPEFSAAFQPPLDPPDGTKGSETHLSNLEEPPSGDLQGAELQMTQHLTEGLEEGSSSPSNKENLRKREASDSGYLSDQAEGVAPSKRKAEPLQDWAESELPMKEGVELAAEEALQSEGPKQKVEPESHLTSDITAAFKSFKAQLEQRFTGCWQEVQAEVLRSLRDCQQHASSLLTAVHQHRLSLLQRFESSVTDHLKQLEENSISLNSMDSEILTFFHSEMEQLSSFCQEHLKKLKNLDSDQLRTPHSSNH
ncbi:synaptonemal complex protein 2-like isoform X2 [Poecilia formosa]|uniref:synaptonemal complex protein 2-like isoform X2 n=1 Tax=Poecilia formosa TaxID=48698 RepID=UPI0007B867A2|nr:PREDICTED: synaptonemal complex protein 2-like isoform X2 [Poecilia formosa]